MDLVHLVLAFTSLVGIVLLGLTYTYIDKLEKIGCACAEHKYRKFIKTYSIVAFVFLVITMVFPPTTALKAFGPMVGKLYTFAVFVPFILATIVYFALALVYVNYLMKEKCKCSEDVRREILYYWSIVTTIIISALYLLPLLKFIVLGAVTLATGSVKYAVKNMPVVQDALVDPVHSVAKVGKMVKKGIRKFK